MWRLGPRRAPRRRRRARLCPSPLVRHHAVYVPLLWSAIVGLLVVAQADPDVTGLDASMRASLLASLPARLPLSDQHCCGWVGPPTVAFPHPESGETMQELLDGLDANPNGAPVPVCPLRGDQVLRWGSQTWIMAILNATPDSFSDGGVLGQGGGASSCGDGAPGASEADRISHGVLRARQLVAEGAMIVDIGGESTRPGATPVPLEEELRRAVPVVRAVAEALGSAAVVSIDTRRAQVAREAVAAGARIVNDISGGLFDPRMLGCVAELEVPLAVMHTRGTPQTMMGEATYTDLIRDVEEELEERVRAALAAGIPRWDLIVDPGLGFAKTGDQNLQILRDLPRLFPCPPGSTPSRLAR